MSSVAGGCRKRQYVFSSDLRRRQVWFGEGGSPGRWLWGFKGHFCQGRPHAVPGPPRSTAARKQGCHGAALALFQGILTLKDWGPCSSAVPTLQGPPPPCRQRRAEPSSLVLGGCRDRASSKGSPTTARVCAGLAGWRMPNGSAAYGVLGINLRGWSCLQEEVCSRSQWEWVSARLCTLSIRLWRIIIFFYLTGQSFYTSEISKLFRALKSLRIPDNAFPEGSHALPQNPSPGPANAVWHPAPCCAGR